MERKWYNFETMFMTLRDELREFLKDNSVYYELSGNGKYYHFEIYANQCEVISISNWISNNSIVEE